MTPQAKPPHADEQPEVLTPVEAKQGRGPRAMLVVLIASLLLGAFAGTALTLYYF